MYKNILASIPGIEFYPIVALVLFFGFFVGLIVWFFLTDESRLKMLAKSALDEGEIQSNKSHPLTTKGVE